MKTAEWLDANQRNLVAEIARVKEYLVRPQTSEVSGGAAPLQTSEVSKTSEVSAGEAVTGFTVSQLQAAFGLSDFERDVLLLCAG
jgi:hypothetical protein